MSFGITLGNAVLHIRRGDLARHREWMLRAFAGGLAISTVVARFSVLSDLSPREFFGIAFWLGFSSHLIAAELWIQHTRPTLRERPGPGVVGITSPAQAPNPP